MSAKWKNLLTIAVVAVVVYIVCETLLAKPIASVVDSINDSIAA